MVDDLDVASVSGLRGPPTPRLWSPFDPAEQLAFRRSQALPSTALRFVRQL